MMTWLSRARAYRDDLTAGIAISFGLAVPAVVIAVGFSLDYAGAIFQDRKLQDIADQAAIAGARELAVGRPNKVQIQAVAQSFVAAALGPNGQTPVSVTTSIEETSSSVTVELRQGRAFKFGALLLGDPAAAFAQATARFVGSTKMCVVALGTANQDGLDMKKQSGISAGGCGVYSNSSHPSRSVAIADDAQLTAAFTCAVGGIQQQGSATIHGSATTDCPVFPDPLAARAKPTIPANCLYKSRLVMKTGNYTLTPGRYCGGLEISGDASVTMIAGEYIMQGGTLVVSGNATLIGTYVGVYFTGNNSGFSFLDNSVVELGAPKLGSMAGILFWKDPNANKGHSYQISSNYTRKLVGTVYLPGAQLIVESNTSVAKNSAWTAIVAESVHSTNFSQVYLNTDYDNTDVPVPKGFDDPTRRKIYLTD